MVSSKGLHEKNLRQNIIFYSTDAILNTETTTSNHNYSSDLVKIRQIDDR